MKKIVFIAPKNKGGTYYYYQNISQELQKNKDLRIIFISSFFWWIKYHFLSADTIFSIVPFVFKPLWAKKYIYNLHGNYHIERKNKWLWVKLLYLSELNLRFSDKIMLTSYYLADKLWFRKKYNHKIIIVPNCIQNINYNTNEKEYDDTQYKILTVTSFDFYDKWKWIINLKKVIKWLAENTDKKIVWSIVWNTEHRNFGLIQSEFEKVRIKNKNVTINFLWRKDRTKLVDLYKSNDRFLYWTALDNYPTVILEAMAYGMKVFVNNYESFRYFLDNNIIYENEERMIRGIFSNRVSNAQLASSHNVFAEINLHIE